MASLEDLKRRVDIWLGRFQSVKEKRNSLRLEVESLRSTLAETKGAISLLQYIAAEVSKTTEKQTADLTTVALREVFPDQKLSLVVKHSNSRGHPGVDFELKDEGHDFTGDPLESFGGGPGVLIGVLLQVICTVRQQGMSKVLILDEPLVAISGRYARLASQLLRKLCDPPEDGGLGFRMLVVTHSSAIASAAHRRYHAETAEDGQSITLTQIEDKSEEGEKIE